MKIILQFLFLFSFTTKAFAHLLKLLMVCLLFSTFYILACDRPEQKSTRKKIDYIKAIPGKNDSIPAKVAEKGEVLIGYLDCYTCHKEDQRSVGPAFKDIAKRYPVHKVY